MGNSTLNHVYRLVWSPVHQALIAVSELTLGPGKKTMRKLSATLVVVASAMTPLAHAGPQGGQITAGSGAISQSANTTTVTQGSQNLSLNWQSFNTSSAETVNFVQPSSSAIAVNRIADVNPTQFSGHLNANGQVYLINPNGIVFGAGSQVNVGGLVASTLDINDHALNNEARTFSGNGTGNVLNQGTITSQQGGYVAFVGKQVVNQGTVNTPGGTTAMAAGKDVTLSFSGDKLVNLQVNQSTLDGLAANGGLIQADGGAVVMSAGAKDAVLASVVNNTGIVQARSVQNVNGTIVLGGGGESVVSNSGTLDASGKQAGETGGTVKVLGNKVDLAATSKIDVSGDLGGGTALVGGNFLGAGPEQNARDVTVAAGSSIKADAISNGKGGKVAIWSDDNTHFNGSITARAGQAGGNGGSVETSGKQLKIGSAASVSTSAAHGQAGDWLLDPTDIRIGGFDVAGDITYQQISNALQNTNVTIKTGATTTCAGTACPAGSNGGGDIILSNGTALGENWSSSTTLTLSAYRNVVFEGNAVIDASFGGGNIVLRADNTGTGIGTIDMGTEGSVYAYTGTVKFYYNPTSYSSPTPYETLLDPTGSYNLINAPHFQAYMYINAKATVANKTYDGTTAATFSGLAPMNDLLSGVTFDVSNASAVFTDKNAGSNKTAVISGVVLGGSDAGKYALNGLDSKTATITKVNLNLSGVTANNKTYDGTTAATLSGTAIASGVIGADSVTVSGSGASSRFDTKNVGTNKAVTVGGYSLSGTDAGNYNLLLPTGLTATVNKANLAVTGVTAAGKTYDASTAATLSGTASVTAIGADAVSVSGTGSGSFVDKNAGVGKSVIVTGYTLSGADAGNYNVVQPTGLTATINRANLGVTGLTAADKTYDATTSAALGGSASVTALGSDAVALSGSATGTFADKNAGIDKAVVVTGLTLSGTDASNYNLVQSNGLTATINKAGLALSGLTASNKTYDGTTAATLGGTATITALGSDVVSVSGAGSGSFADKNVGSGKAVTVSGYTLSGADAGNYNLAQQTGLTADVSKANIGLTGINAANKTYDGTTAATLTGTASVSAIGGDVVSVNGSGAASFADKNAGTGKAVTVSGYSLSGADAGNYNLLQPSGLTADVSKANIGVTGLTATNKTYDGTTAATLSGTATVAAIGSDAVTVSGSGSGSFADKNAGADKAVVVSGYTLSGADASNYNLVQPVGFTATISKADIALTGLSAADKTYDGTTAATLSGTASVTALGSDVVNIAGSGSGSFVDKNVGTGKAVAVSGFTLSGTDAGNYNLLQPTGLAAAISKVNIGVTGVSAADKTYDGTTTATLTGLATVNAIGSDVVSVSGNGSGSFTDKNVGAGKAVAVSGYTLSGADAGNYNLLQPSGLAAAISKADIGVAGLSAADKTYDGTTGATLSGSASINAFGSDVIGLGGSATGAFVDKNAGSSKAVSVSGLTLTGIDAGNYNLVQPNGLTATINKADLALSGLSASNKTYDGTTAATLSGVANVTAFGSDVVTVSGNGSGSFADKNAGTGKLVAVSGLTLSGADANNYNLLQPTGLTADISKADIGLTGVTAADKVYDASTTATLSGTASVNALGSDVLLVAGNGSGSFADKNAGAGKAVTVTGYSLSGADAGNYNLLQPTGLTASISKATIGVTGLSAADKTYDGTTAAMLSGTATVAALGSDVVAVSGSGTGSFADKNAGADKAVMVSGYTLSGTDAGNYNLVQPIGVTATISKADIALTGVSATDKTYDGTTAATLSGTATINALGSDVVNVSGSGSGSFVDKNVGTSKAVTVGGYTLSGTDAGNYNLVQPIGLTARISKADVAVTGVTAASKTYDGTTAATLTGLATVNAIGSDVVSVSGNGSGSFADKNVGAGKTVTASGYTLSGADAGNYNLLQPTGLAAAISKANIGVTGLTAADKVYDGTTAAMLGGNASITAFGSDTLGLSGNASGAFADKNAGSSKAVSVSGFTLTGADAGNYNLVQPNGLTATINKADLALSGLTANNKTYDGTTAATLSGVANVTAFGSDVVTVSGNGSGSFADKNAGTGKLVAVSGLTLSGADAGNYNLLQPTGLTADVSKADISVTGVLAADKTYDASTAATLNGTASVNALGSDVLVVAGNGSGSFADKNAGAGKAVTVTGYSLSGADAGNYNLLQPTGLTANVSKADIGVTGLTAADKTYDGTTAATLGGNASISAFGNDVVSVAGNGSASFSDKNAGTGKAVVVSGYTLSGTDAGNYNLVQPIGLTARINKADIAVTGVAAASKTYDGTTAATLTGLATVNAIGGDVVAVSGSGNGSFADKNAGAGKAVSANGYTLSGADAGNYNLLQPTGLTASISKADISVTGLTAADKVYDATTAATLRGSASINAFCSDVLGLSGNAAGAFADKNAGSSKAVSVSGFTLTGADAGNYNLLQPTGLTASISKANIGVTGLIAADKTYDGTTAAMLGGNASISAFGNDVVSVAGNGSASFSDKNAGTGKAVVVSGYTLNGTDAGNYNLVQPNGLTATINKADLALSGLSANNKTYDGTTAATMSGVANVTAFGSDVVTVSGNGSGSFADKNAGTGKLVAVSGLTLSGADANNYNLLQPTGLTADISKADIRVTGVIAADKVYDASTAATLNGTASVNALGSDVLLVAGNGSASFADKNAGVGKAVTVTGYSLSGADAGNYNLLQPIGLTATISKADLALAGLNANNKVYDGTTGTTLSGTAAVSALGGDAVGVSGSGSASFTDKNAGAGKAVTVSGYTLTGADAGNYNLVQPAGLTANISKATIGVTGVTATDKVYDASTAATLNGSASISAFGSDVVSVAGNGSASFADKNAGTGKAVVVSGYTLSGADAGNYNLLQPTGLTASISKADIAVSGLSATSKVYDATTLATLGGVATVTALASDKVSLSGTGVGNFVDKNVGANKAVSISGYSLSGADAGNYNLLVPAGFTADITPASLTVSGISASSKVFDGTTNATLDTGGTQLGGLFAGDDVALASSGTFADAAVGSNKAVNLSHRLSGADSGNYQLIGQTITLADITAVSGPGTSPVAPVLVAQNVQSAVTQVQSVILAPQATAQPRALSLSSTINVRNELQGTPQSTEQGESDSDDMAVINTVSNLGTPAPLLTIQNGGVQLPPVAASTKR